MYDTDFDLHFTKWTYRYKFRNKTDCVACIVGPNGPTRDILKSLEHKEINDDLASNRVCYFLLNVIIFYDFQINAEEILQTTFLF